MQNRHQELTVIQKTYDLILWYVPIIERLPRSQKFNLGARIEAQLYLILEEMITAKFEKTKVERLFGINIKLELLRHQTRLLFDLKLFDGKKLHHVSQLINGIGIEIGGWIKQQKAAG